ncbi:ribonuclease N [Chryseobacterium manosquense]|uniref:Ribonuclease n=1 Tax=Chryseobacterium manosquense TaxID=2754694 RepID=A0A7H1DTF6_9FLAO|nr:ribonuclease domain-containing protein [Chryseobacterium manosquense]MDN5578864.1 ribonuclease N [Chryseobacterium sp.]QNS40264.1 ribonuclease N [Chryseobacterium manosquense]
MNKNSAKLALFFIIGMLSAFLVMYLIDNYRIEKRNQDSEIAENTIGKDEKANREEISLEEHSIQNLTNEVKVINYVKSNHELPDYYITKSEARKQGWVPSEGNLCDVLPGKAIGGDKFSNREKTLPSGKQYFEADVNYNCGNRNADRIVFTKEGEVYLTKNHYKSFQKQ